MLEISQSTVWNITKYNLEAEVRRKTKTHALSDKQVAQLIVKGPRLLRNIMKYNLEAEVRKKTKTHALSDKQVAQQIV
jgi:butyrate kinase